jgi:hypothetical protein
MPEKVKLNEELGIVEVQSFGTVAFDEMAESIKNIKKIHEEMGVGKVLVDASDMTAAPSTGDMFNLASMFPQDLRLAIVISKDNALHENLDFGKTVALNRGVLISLFNSREEALKWLLE